MSSQTPAVMWFRRDLRTADNPALLAALADGPTLPLFVLDPRLFEPAGPSRRAYLVASLRSLGADLPLAVRHGDPVREVVRAAQEVGAVRVHVAADFGPYGHQRDLAVQAALREVGIDLVRTGAPYAVVPGTVKNGSGESFKVFTPFSRVWRAQPRPHAVPAPQDPTWLHLDQDDGLPDVELPEDLRLPEAGEQAAHQRWQGFLETIGDYDTLRDQPGVDGTSRLSVHLKYGEVHPRQLVEDLGRLRSKGAHTYETELIWREFYADVLFRRPDSARDYYRPELARMRYDDPHAASTHLREWQEGRTGFPIVDAGMRQLRSVGWMHNRVRMITASFLVKDLHVEWQYGARHFLQWLADGDIASNNHGWQWVAGTGTDAAPYFRVFNPTTQGRKFDPSGEYLRRWVPELADVVDPHDPSGEDRLRVDYPEPIVDHQQERLEALERYQEARA